MGLARQDRGAPTQAGVGSPPSRCNKELDRNPPAPEGFRAARGRLLCCRSSAMSRIACVAASCIRPRGARNPTPPT